MKAFIREILTDTALLSALIILPLAFLGPGWRTNITNQTQNGSFRNQHKFVPGETPEERSNQFERDIPILRAFEVEREARESRDHDKGG